MFMRDAEIRRMRARIEARGFPRVEMTIILGLTAAAGFLTSFALLEVGVASMALRYPLALGIAYLVFLLLLWAWLRQSLDIPEPGADGSSSSGGCGGSSGADAVDGVLEGAGEALGAADEFLVPLIVLGLLVAILLSSMWVIYSAPVLFAELLVDSAIASGLYKRLAGIESRHWLRAAVRRTIVPLVCTAAILAGAGKLMTHYAPHAVSLGEVVHQLGQ